MDVKFAHPSLLYRQYEGGDAELIAICSYLSDAEDLAKRKLAEDAARNWKSTWYLIINTYNGQATTIRHKKKEPNDGKD